MLKTIFLSGTAVNVYLIVLGSAVGMILKKGIPERVRKTLIWAISLSVLYIGVSGLFSSDINALIVIISLAVGAIIGELIDLDKWVDKLAKKIEDLFSGGKGTGQIAEGFIAATLVFCIGAMAIVGSIDSGIRGDNTTLYSKSLIDGITAAVFASTLGVGVMFSAFPIIVIEGGMTLLATLLVPVLTERTIAHMGVVGSLLIICISFNMLGLTKIKVMNLVPAVFIPILLVLFM